MLKSKLLCGILAAITALSCLGGCVSTDKDKNTFTPYDEALRVEDTRVLTDNEYTEYNLSALDGCNRQLVAVDGVASDRKIGMFYFLSLGQHSNHRGIYDIGKITADSKKPENFQQDSERTPNGAAHFWGEPVWGYYNSTDEWVIRKQIEMLTLAGVDFLIFDTSNAVLYPQCTKVVFKVLEEYRLQGWKVPQFMYYLAQNDQGVYYTNIQELYDTIYSKNLYKELWFAPNGKPLITKHQSVKLDRLGAGIADCFDFRNRQWPTEDFDPNGIPWIEFEYPQQVHKGWINVSAAQHAGSIRMSDPNTWGKGYDFETGLNDREQAKKGYNFDQQWKTANANKEDVDFVFITGWNEWVAQKMRDQEGVFFTVDLYDMDFNRDLEPTKGAHKDNGYMQTIQKIHEFNYKEAKHYVYPKVTIDTTTTTDKKWDNIRAYKDFVNDATKRNSIGMCKTEPKYVDNSNRNDIASVKVTRDDSNMYFKIETKENITPFSAGDKNWMNIMIKTRNCNPNKNYMGYDYVINREVNGAKTKVMKASAQNELSVCGEGDILVSGKSMVVKVPLSAINLAGANYDIEFKVCDNITNPTDILDYYSTGDSAPIGRLNYRYGY